MFTHVYSEFSDCCAEFELSFLSQFVFVYQRGMNTGGDVALDDITILPGGCYSEPTINPPDDKYGNLRPSLATSTEQTVILHHEKERIMFYCILFLWIVWQFSLQNTNYPDIINPHLV